ncbi:MAG: response regulator [Deltaproteobacteria bacterium]|nr:response regulator [Deltaproteobacteria bacterium]
MRDEQDSGAAQEAAKLRARVRQLTTLVDAVREAIIIIRGGTIVFANAYMHHLGGHTLAEIAGRSFLDFVHPDDRPLVAERHRQRLMGQDVPSVYDLRILTREGEPRWIQVSTTTIDWDGIPAHVALLTDIEARKRAEESLQHTMARQEAIIWERTRSLQEANERLEAEILERIRAEENLRRLNESLLQEIKERRQATERLEEAKRRALESSRAKSMFLARMSHEMRTPLNVILGMSRVAQRDAPEGCNTRPMEMIAEAGQTMLRVIDDLLDISKIEAGRMTLDENRFDLPGFLKGLRDSHATLFKAKGLQLELEIRPGTPAFVVGDRARLGQILHNLLSNALKFTATGGAEIEAGPLEPGETCMEQSEGRLGLVFKVKDTGMGIPADRLNKIFDSFEQADETIGRRFGGTGLGLSISRHLARLMGGEVRVESTEAQGTTFVLTVPMVPTEEEDEECVAVQEDDFIRPLDILLAEDSDLNAETVEALLAPQKHRLTRAGNGREALEILRNRRFDVVLMDIQMPEMDGLEATRAIRKSSDIPSGADVPIVAMTAFGMEQDRRRIMQAGVTDYVPKPVNLERLTRVLAKCVGKDRQAEDQNPSHAEASDRIDDWGRARQEALENMGGRKDLLHRLSQVFLRDTPRDLEALDMALAEGRVKDAARHAHSIKGNALNIGVGAVAKAAKNVELALGRGRDLKELRRDLEKAVEAAAGLLAAEGIEPAA